MAAGTGFDYVVGTGARVRMVYIPAAAAGIVAGSGEWYIRDIKCNVASLMRCHVDFSNKDG